MTTIQDGPSSPFFRPVRLHGNANISDLAARASSETPVRVSEQMAAAFAQAPQGSGVSWGIPFEIESVVLVSDSSYSMQIEPTRARWLIFLHTSDVRPLAPDSFGVYSPMPGEGQLGEHAAEYVMEYEDGSKARVDIRRRHQLGPFQRNWGENCFQSVAHHKPFPLRAAHEQLQPFWGVTQMRVLAADEGPWVNWLWAWENPYPDKVITSMRFEPGVGAILISAVTAGDVDSLPLRWEGRRKACLTLPEGEIFQPDLDANGLLQQVQIDLGQVISASPRLIYPNHEWEDTYNNQLPEKAVGQILFEYTAHPQANFHLQTAAGTRLVPVSAVQEAPSARYQDDIVPIEPVVPAQVLVKLRVVERTSRKPVPVKMHLHGEYGEYLAPVDRHRVINPAWFEDYSVDFLHILNWEQREAGHSCTYINGETVLRLPLGKVYLEISKGFEIHPLRKVLEITGDSHEVVVEIDKALHWRERGWVTADTHVHFLSPGTALLEGAAEGVNVINLLASQWGELMTNVGDFDGKTTWGEKEAGGGPENNGEYLVRVGSENRQHVLGHISLLGYRGPIIAPMTTGGPDEAALGDPVDVLMTEWARQCRAQGGLVVFPHFPRPRAEAAATIISGEADAVEMTSWDDHYRGIDPYSLSDWYRYLNCGYLIPAVGGTDKMYAAVAVGTVRTYARLSADTEFGYDAWKQAVRRKETFVTYGPLMEFMVDGHPMGSTISLSHNGGSVDVLWQVESVTIPVTRVELVVNGETRESLEVDPGMAAGHWRLHLPHSAWLALRARGRQPGKPEMIAAHSTPVMVCVDGSPLLNRIDAATILDQVEGAQAYLDTVATRAAGPAYQRMRQLLDAAHRSLHDRMLAHPVRS